VEKREKPRIAELFHRPRNLRKTVDELQVRLYAVA